MPGRSAPRAATAVEGAGERDERLDAFRAGLYPILLAGDVAAFRRYLAQWEDVIGDTAELAETPLDQQRKTMAALLRRPSQFNLPPWHTADEAPDRAGEREAVSATENAAHLRLDNHRESDDAAGAEAARGTYQLDMLTGEFVPIALLPPRAVEDEPPGEPPAPPRKRRARRRGGNVKLAQLALWPETAPDVSRGSGTA